MKKNGIVNSVVSFIVSMVVFVSNLNVLIPISVSASTNVSNLNPTDSTFAFLREIEKYSSECYWDNLQWSIGYGTKCPYTHSRNGNFQGEKGGHTISESQAREQMQSKISVYVSTLKSNCKGLSMTQNQFDALLSATYNHGNILENGCSDCSYQTMPLVKYLMGKLSADDARNQYYSWCVMKGTMYETGLRSRRKKEAELFFSDTSPIVNDTELNIPYPRPQCSSTHWLGDGTVGSVTGIKKGSEVGWLQTALNRAINAGLDVDCEIGAKTTDAIKNFQSKYGLTADGYAGEKTINKLVEVLKNQITLGTPLFSVITVKKPNGNQKGTVNISWYKTENATGYYIRVGSYSLGKSTDIDVGKATDYTFTYGNNFFESYDAQDLWLQLIAVNSTYGLKSVSEKTDITLVPADPNKLTIHYNVSGGNLADDSEYYTASNGDIYRKADNKILAPVWKDDDSHEHGLYNASTFKMTRTGWHFLGWSKAKSSGTIFDQHDNTITASDIYPEIKNQDGTVTLYARWDENEYNVIFNANGGATPTASKSVEYSKTYGNLPTPTRSGYTFNGWYTSANGGTKITADSKVTITSNQTLYAQWKAIPTTTTAPTTTASKITTTATAKVTTTVATTLPHLSVEEYEVSLSVKEQYVIKANQSDLTYKSDNEDVVIVSKNGIITAVGNGETIILVSNSSGDAVKIKVKVISQIKGDANNDGEVTVADAVMLQKWLLGAGDLSNWKNTDLCEDGVIDIFDMIEMRKLLIQNK